jgi:tetratricopeptide (TPR) repeat protein
MLVWATLCLGGVLPSTRLVTCALAAALILAHFLDPGAGPRAHPAGWLLVPFLLYGAANVAWVSPVKWLGWFDWLNWSLAALVFWVVLNGVRSGAVRGALCGVLVLLGAACGALAIFQHFLDPDWIMMGRRQAEQYLGRSSGAFGGPNSLGAFCALLLPPIGWEAARGRGAARAACMAAFPLVGAGLVLSVSRGAWLGLIAALAVAPLLLRGAGAARRVATAALSLAAAAACAAALYALFPLMRDRVGHLVTDMGEKSRPIIWRGAWRIFEGHPVLGAGAASFDSAFEAFRPLGFQDQPVYAHCDYLNTLCDYGVVGFLLAFGAAAAIACRLRRSRGLAAAAFTGLLAFSFHLLVEFHLKVPALAMALAVVAALTTQQAWPAAVAARARRGRAAALFAFAAAAFAVAWAVPRYRAEALRLGGRDRIDRVAARGGDISKEPAELAGIRADLARAVAIDRLNAQAWSDKAYADSLEALVVPGDTARLGEQAVKDADAALALDPLRFEFWIRKGTGLDMQRRWPEGGGCFAKALVMAPNRADVWYYEAYHLSLKASETGPAMAAVNLCLRLDPGFLLAQALRQRLANRR